MKTQGYTVFVRWGRHSHFMVPVRVQGVDLRDAAQRRVRMLSDPRLFNDVLVVHTSHHGVAAIYRIADLLDGSGDKGSPVPQSNAPQPRYGWRG